MIAHKCSRLEEPHKLPSDNDLKLADVKGDMSELSQTPALLPLAMLENVVATTNAITQSVAEHVSDAMATMPLGSLEIVKDKTKRFNPLCVPPERFSHCH